MFVFQLGISIVQPRHRVYFLNDFINESGKSTWFLKSSKVKVCEWVPDSLWPCFYYFFPCKFCAGFIYIFLPERESDGPRTWCVLVLPLLIQRCTIEMSLLPCHAFLWMNFWLPSFSNDQRGFYPLIYPLILSVNLSPVLVIKPKYPHSLYMVVAMPLCRYLICASVHWAPPACECASPHGDDRGCGLSQESAPALQELGRAYQVQCGHSEQKPESNSFLLPLN